MKKILGPALLAISLVAGVGSLVVTDANAGLFDRAKQYAADKAKGAAEAAVESAKVQAKAAGQDLLKSQANNTRDWAIKEAEALRKKGLDLAEKQMNSAIDVVTKKANKVAKQKLAKLEQSGILTAADRADIQAELKTMQNEGIKEAKKLFKEAKTIAQTGFEKAKKTADSAALSFLKKAGIDAEITKKGVIVFPEPIQKK